MQPRVQSLAAAWLCLPRGRALCWAGMGAHRPQDLKGHLPLQGDSHSSQPNGRSRSHCAMLPTIITIHCSSGVAQTVGVARFSKPAPINSSRALMAFKVIRICF